MGHAPDENKMIRPNDRRFPVKAGKGPNRWRLPVRPPHKTASYSPRGGYRLARRSFHVPLELWPPPVLSIASCLVPDRKAWQK